MEDRACSSVAHGFSLVVPSLLSKPSDEETKYVAGAHCPTARSATDAAMPRTVRRQAHTILVQHCTEQFSQKAFRTEQNFLTHCWSTAKCPALLPGWQPWQGLQREVVGSGAGWRSSKRPVCPTRTPSRTRMCLRTTE